METPLDKVLNAARANPELGEEYLNLFLNSEMYVPVWNEIEKQAQAGGPGGHVNIKPVMANNEEGEYIMAFDTKERLEDWADQPFGGVAALNGIDVLMMVQDKPLQVCINAGTDFIKVFTREEIEWILDNVEKAPPS